MLAKILAATLLVTLGNLSASAQSYSTQPPTYNNGPSFTYCEALVHNHDETLSVGYASRWAGQGLVSSDCNNEANLFLGNTFRAQHWGFVETYWYDWSDDIVLSGQQQAVWGSGWEPITIYYCGTCKMALRLSSPNFP